MTERKDNLDIETALKNREFEIQLFWQRANYFLVLITALGIGVFTVQNEFLALLISIFGTVSSLLWFRTNLGSRFWQMFWEGEVEKLSKDYNIASFLISTEEIKNEMRTNLEQSGRAFGMRRWIDKMVITKPSVTYSMILLSFAALLFWIGVSCVHAWELFFVANTPVS